MELAWKFFFVVVLCLQACLLTQAEILDEITAVHNVPADVILAANLTARELELLPEVQWDAAGLNLLNHQIYLGIPDGVECEREKWCDAVACTEVCKRGTVKLEPWFQLAMKSQIALSRELPLCYAQWLGTHNSGITLADGYGNRDPFYTELLKLTKWGSQYEFKTHNQWFSITDQLNMGARMIELDVHYVKGALRIAHCGGLYNFVLDHIASLVNLIAALLQSPFRWDVSTVGCYPSASSIEAGDQRLFIDAMQEIAEWLNRDDNRDEFLIILLDDQLNLATWDLLPELRRQLKEYIPYEQIFTPVDMLGTEFQPLPSAKTLLEKGKRVMFLSVQYYSDIPTRLLVFFTKEGRICDWREPHPETIDLQNCTIPPDRIYPRRPTMTGQACRLEVCEIEYGPFSCNLEWGGNACPGIKAKQLKNKNGCSGALDSSILTEVFDCGFNFPSPDNLTPERAMSAIWSWAPGYPQIPDSVQNKKWHTVINAEDGLWRSKDADLTSSMPIVCRRSDSDLQFTWHLQLPNPSGPLCDDGFVPGVPRHGKENAHLQQILQQQGIQEARLFDIN